MTTTDLLTFFHPGEASGTTWTFSSPAGSEWREIWAYVEGEADLSRLMGSEPLSEERFSQLYAEIENAVRNNGGILVEAKAHNDVIRLTVALGEGAGYRFPGKMLRLKTYGDPCFESITRSIDLMAGDHLIVPVSATAEQKLGSFREELRGLPADLESSIFNVIRRPSLEWRINRIERILSLPPATQAEAQRSRAQKESLWQTLRRFFMWPVPAGFVAAGLLLLTGAIAGYNSLSGPAPETVGTDDTTSATGTAEASTSSNPKNLTPSAKPSGDTGENTPKTEETEAESKMKQSLGKLLQALDDSQNAAIKTLYEKHFQGSSSALAGWGMAKLQALHLGIVNPDNPVLSDPTAWTAIKDIYRSKEGREALENNKEASAVLARSSCTYLGKPELPATQNNTNSPLAFGKEPDCTKLSSGDVLAGLEDLTDWVKEQKK